MKYLENIRREIQLPSGGKVTVRRQTKHDLILIGQPPAKWLRDYRIEERADALKDGQAKAKLLETIAENTPEDEQRWMEFIARQARILMTRCCVTPMIFDDGRLTIVDKEPADCAEGEINWGLVEDRDARAILDAINQLTNTKADREAAKTFPEESENTGGTGRAGAAVSLPANRTPETQPA